MKYCMNDPMAPDMVYIARTLNYDFTNTVYYKLLQILVE